MFPCLRAQGSSIAEYSLVAVKRDTCVLVCLYALRGFTRPSYISGGEGGGGRGKAPDFGAPLPQTAQIHWRRRNFTAGPWGSFMGSHRGTPPPPHDGPFAVWGSSGEGIKRWGIEGIRIGTSDRFGRGRGEFVLSL